jgi:aryl-alcohol dehydrogenase-like predicted oxidoreductase
VADVSNEARPLGSTGVTVWALGYGAMELHGPLPPDLYEEAQRRLPTA